MLHIGRYWYLLVYRSTAAFSSLPSSINHQKWQNIGKMKKNIVKKLQIEFNSLVLKVTSQNLKTKIQLLSRLTNCITICCCWCCWTSIAIGCCLESRSMAASIAVLWHGELIWKKKSNIKKIMILSRRLSANQFQSSNLGPNSPVSLTDPLWLNGWLLC